MIACFTFLDNKTVLKWGRLIKNLLEGVILSIKSRPVFKREGKNV